VQAAALHTLTTLSLLKNVPVDPGRLHEIMEGALYWLGPTEFEQIIERDPAGLRALTWATNVALDLVVTSRIVDRAKVLETDSSRRSVMIDEITRAIRAEARDKTCLRWPDPDELVERHYDLKGLSSNAVTARRDAEESVR
jgi:hypothetical protein